jgi:hypothetical protein
MNTWKTARTDPRLNTGRQNGWLYVQWHHGTDSRKDALPEGGWEIERAKYPGLSLPLPTGQVLHGQAKLLDCWVAESLTVAALATRTTWYLGRTGEAQELSAYQPGAWSRFHVLAYVADMERLAVLTLRSAASQILGQQLRLYGRGVLALAQRAAPDLPPAAFWLTIRPGPVERRGEPGNASAVTLPLIGLPDPADEAAVTAWLDANFVGQELLDRFAELLPEIERFCGGSGLGGEATPPPSARPGPAGQDAVSPPAGDAGDDAVEVWPPRAPWVARWKNGAGVDWATSFWQLAALLSMNADDARRILREQGDDLEAAAAAIWEGRPR